MQRICYFIGCVALSAGVASAHPGHGNPATEDGMVHYLSTPLHAAPIGVAATMILLFAVGYVWRRRTVLSGCPVPTRKD